MSGTNEAICEHNYIDDPDFQAKCKSAVAQANNDPNYNQITLFKVCSSSLSSYTVKPSSGQCADAIITYHLNE